MTPSTSPPRTPSPSRVGTPTAARPIVESTAATGRSGMAGPSLTTGRRHLSCSLPRILNPGNLEHELMHSQIIRFSKRYTY